MAQRLVTGELVAGQHDNLHKQKVHTLMRLNRLGLAILLTTATVFCGRAGAQTIIKKLNPGSKVVSFWMQNSTTGASVTGLTGAAIGTPVSLTAGAAGSFSSIQYSTNGGAYANCSGTIDEVGKGFYAYTPTSGESNTTLDVIFLAQATSCFDYAAMAQFNSYKVDDIGMALLPTQGTIAAASSGVTINTTLTAPAVNCYKGQIIVFTSGVDIGQTAVVASNTTGANSVLIVMTAPTSNPSSADAFSLTAGVGQREVDVLTSLTAMITSNVFTTASLVNAPTGGSAPTTAQIASAVWQDLLAGGDFGVALSGGAALRAFMVASPSGWLASDSASLAAITSNVFSHVVETGVTYQQLMEIIGAYLGGNANFNTGVYYALDNPTIPRMSFTVIDGIRAVTPTP